MQGSHWQIQCRLYYLNNAERFNSALVAQRMPEIGNSPMRCAVATVAIGMSKWNTDISICYSCTPRQRELVRMRSNVATLWACSTSIRKGSLRPQVHNIDVHNNWFQLQAFIVIVAHAHFCMLMLLLLHIAANEISERTNTMHAHNHTRTQSHSHTHESNRIEPNATEPKSVTTQRAGASILFFHVRIRFSFGIHNCTVYFCARNSLQISPARYMVSYKLLNIIHPV